MGVGSWSLVRGLGHTEIEEAELALELLEELLLSLLLSGSVKAPGLQEGRLRLAWMLLAWRLLLVWMVLWAWVLLLAWMVLSALCPGLAVVLRGRLGCVGPTAGRVTLR